MPPGSRGDVGDAPAPQEVGEGGEEVGGEAALEGEEGQGGEDGPHAGPV